LDVEGAEMVILQSIDWTQLDIDVFTIETDQHRQEILTFMKTHGYKWIKTLTYCLVSIRAMILIIATTPCGPYSYKQNLLLSKPQHS
jgi:hypothetical protein